MGKALENAFPMSRNVGSAEIQGAALRLDVVHRARLITDGRFSGGNHGFVVGHISPDARIGGTLGRMRNREGAGFMRKNQVVVFGCCEFRSARGNDVRCCALPIQIGGTDISGACGTRNF